MRPQSISYSVSLFIFYCIARYFWFWCSFYTTVFLSVLLNSLFKNLFWALKAFRRDFSLTSQFQFFTLFLILLCYSTSKDFWQVDIFSTPICSTPIRTILYFFNCCLKAFRVMAFFTLSGNFFVRAPYCAKTFLLIGVYVEPPK